MINWAAPLLQVLQMAIPNKFTTNIEAYQHQVDLYRQQVQKIITEMKQAEIKPYLGMHTIPALEGEGKMAKGKELIFTVHGVANGFIAETAGGNVVVGSTLSDVCAAAQAKLAEEKLAPESPEMAAKADPSSTPGWRKLFSS
jgi:hypothetical protein